MNSRAFRTERGAGGLLPRSESCQRIAHAALLSAHMNLRTLSPLSPNRLVTVFTLLVAATVTVTAADAAAPAKSAGALPSADELLARHVQALGGRTAMEKLTSRSVKGSLELPSLGATTPALFLAKAPNKQWNEIEIPGFGTIHEGFDGATGWVQSPQGVQDKAGAELTELKRRAVFNRELKLKQLYPKLSVLRKDKVGERDAFVLQATPADGPLELWYLDAQTSLLLRMDARLTTQFGEFDAETYFEDFREVDGVKIAFRIRRPKPAEQGFVLQLTEVKHNVPIADAKFAKPAGQ